MRFLLSVLVLISPLVSANKSKNKTLTTFNELASFEIAQTKKNISIRGFFFLDNEEYVFCSNMEACYSRGKERVIIKASSELKEYLRQVDECHMELSGEFHPLSYNQSGWPITGYFFIEDKPEFDFSSKYGLINSRCLAFNMIQNTKQR